MVTVRAMRIGTHKRRTKGMGSVPVKVAAIRVTAATGDMVRPAADPMETMAPT